MQSSAARLKAALDKYAFAEVNLQNAFRELQEAKVGKNVATNGFRCF